MSFSLKMDQRRKREAISTGPKIPLQSVEKTSVMSETIRNIIDTKFKNSTTNKTYVFPRIASRLVKPARNPLSRSPSKSRGNSVILMKKPVRSYLSLKKTRCHRRGLSGNLCPSLTNLVKRSSDMAKRHAFKKKLQI